MSPQFVLDTFAQATWIAIQCSGPLLALGIGVGLLMGLIQAATQISEPALTFVPKLGALGAGLFLFGGWMIERLTALGHQMLSAVGNL